MNTTWSSTAARALFVSIVGIVWLAFGLGTVTFAQDFYMSTSKEVSPDRIYPGSCTQTPNQARVTLTLSNICERGVPADFMLVIDRSTTMLIDSRIDSAKAAAKTFVDLMRDVDRAGLVSFSDDVTLDFSLTAMDSAGKIALRAAIDGLAAYGYTNLGDAIREANHEIEAYGRGGDTQAVHVLLSDGLPNRPLSVPDPVAYALTAADTSRMLGIQIEAIGLALTVAEGIELLQDIADTTGGQYYDSPTPDQLRAIFEEIAGGVCNLLTNVVVTEYLHPCITYEGSPTIEPDAVEFVELSDILGTPNVATKLTWTIPEMIRSSSFSVSFDVSYTCGPYPPACPCPIETEIVVVDVEDSSKVTFDINGTMRRDTTFFPQEYLIVDPCPGVIEAEKTDSLYGDSDGNGRVSHGDTLLYEVTIRNMGTTSQPGVSFIDTIDTHTSLVPLSVSSTQGEVLSGNAPGDTVVQLDIGSISAEGSVIITFLVVIVSPLPPGVDVIVNQGTVTGTNISPVLTDDPDTPLQILDPTRTPVSPVVDVGITSEDIFFDPEIPVAGEPVTISAVTHCDPASDPMDSVLVCVYDGDPDAGGQQIGDCQMCFDLTPGATCTVHVMWILSSEEILLPHDICVRIDADERWDEFNEENNEACRTMMRCHGPVCPQIVTHVSGFPETFLKRESCCDTFAVWYENTSQYPIKIESIDFMFFDPGRMKVAIYEIDDGPVGICDGTDHLGTRKYGPQTKTFVGAWDWEKLDLEGLCWTIDPGEAFFVVLWNATCLGDTIPRILAQSNPGGTHSWYAKGTLDEFGEGCPSGVSWTCYEGWEYMVRLNVNCTPSFSLDIQPSNVTWIPKYPFEADSVYELTALPADWGLRWWGWEYWGQYTPIATICNVGDREVAEGTVQFYEADWGFFQQPYPREAPICEEEISIEPGDMVTVECPCGYIHQKDPTDWSRQTDYVESWSRNIVIRYPRNVAVCEDPVLETEYVYVCWRTIWPKKDWPWWGIPPIPLPVYSEDPATFAFSVLDPPAEWMFDFDVDEGGWAHPGGGSVTIHLTVVPRGSEPGGPVVVRVEAENLDTGEKGVVNLEFMPYTEPDPLAGTNVYPENITVTRFSPCDEEPYTVCVDFVSDACLDPYYISFGWAPWGFFQEPELEEIFYDTVVVCSAQRVQICPLAGETPFYRYEPQPCGWWGENIVIDYEVYYHNGFYEDWWEKKNFWFCWWVWQPPVPWPWEPIVVEIPVHNPEDYPVVIELDTVNVPALWAANLSEDLFDLEPGATDTAYMTVFPPDDFTQRPDKQVNFFVRAEKVAADMVIHCGQVDVTHALFGFKPYNAVEMECIYGPYITPPGDSPGNDWDAQPGGTVEFPICLGNDAKVYAAEIEINYDPTVLTVATVVATERCSVMNNFDYYEGPPLKINIGSTLGESGYIAQMEPEDDCPDELAIVTVHFTIGDMILPGTKTDITFESVVLSDLDGEAVCALVQEDGCICVGGKFLPWKCDVDSSGDVTLVDLFAILKHIVHMIPDPLDTEFKLWAADYNGDGTINILDLMSCIRLASGEEPPLAKVAVPGVEVAGVPGQVVRVPVQLISDVAWGGALFCLRYDPLELRPLAAVLTDRSGEMMVAQNAAADGQVSLLVYSDVGEVISAGSRAILEVPFQVARNAEGVAEVAYDEAIVFTPEAEAVILDAPPITLKLRPVPTEYSLTQNYPNPFNPETTIEYQLPQPGDVILTVYNLLGQSVQTLVAEGQEAGYYSVRWDGRDSAGVEVSSGVYFYRLTAGGYSRTMRMVLMK